MNGTTNRTTLRAAVATAALALTITLAAVVPATAVPRPVAVLAVGSTASSQVSELQRQLNSVLSQVRPLKEDGLFGPLTEDSVRWFQTCVRITVDGIAGPQTRAALDAAASRKVDSPCLSSLS
ncbi:peptidoglycan-binding protein [Kitasatospora purpeofusca]|uniref:peptidoglycan-binding domain-containing protein n=1 Tax=Kitasatospora purpeofusca TaxID=67352 RepID=UPI0035D85433